MRRRIVGAILCVLTPMVACAQADGNVYQKVLAGWGQNRIKHFSFDTMPFCLDMRDAPRCVAHSASDVQAVQRVLTSGQARKGWSFKLSPVRDSAGTKVVYLITWIDSISPEYGSSEMYRFILDSRGTKVLSQKGVMGETIARRP